MRNLSRRTFLLAGLALTTLAACADDPLPGPTEELPEAAQSTVARDLSPSVSRADARALGRGNTSFAFDIYDGFATDQTSNVFYSPYSISLALAMTYAGADANTKKQIAKALHFDLPESRLHPAFDALDLELESRSQTIPESGGNPLTLNIANSLWCQKKMPFEQPFLDRLAKSYGAGVFLADFIHAFEDAREDINGWVSNQTNDKIPNLLPEGSLDPSTRLVLVDAIYFNASWADPFSAGATTNKPFSRLDGSKKTVKTMAKEGSLGYAEGGSYQAVQIPYAGNETSMVVVLPKAGKFATVESQLSQPFVDGIFDSLQGSEVILELPKFTIKGDTVSLKSKLQALGMKDAFEPIADFTRIVDPKVDRLHVDDVLHQAFVAVDEKGTEAAAATAVIFGDTAAPIGIKHVKVNRPFFFFIRDVPTNTVLFVGRVMDPSQ